MLLPLGRLPERLELRDAAELDRLELLASIPCSPSEANVTKRTHAAGKILIFYSLSPVLSTQIAKKIPIPFQLKILLCFKEVAAFEAD